MNKRQAEILKVLYKSRGNMTFAEIAKQMDVSVKTVRNDVASIKKYLTQQGVGAIEAKPHTGIRLIISEPEWKRLISQDECEERAMFFFIIRHLFKNDNLTAQRLAQQYYIGRTQLEKVLLGVSQWFSENHILFERRRGKGISIRYSEFNYRMAYLMFYTEYMSFFAELLSERQAKYAVMTSQEYTAMCAAFDGFEPDKIAMAVMETEEEFGLRISYASGIDLLFLISLCIIRSKKAHNVEMPKVAKCPADGESGSAFAAKLIKNLEKEQSLMLSKEEIDFITFAVEISEIQEFASENSRRGFEVMNIELCRLTVKIVNLISEIAGVDLREDRFFVKQMFIQLKASIPRLKYGIVYKNQLLTQIKTKYPNMMAVAWLLGNIFEKELGLEINEHEVGFLALHIGGAIERQIAGFSACIVCDYGIGLSQILKEKITRAIPELTITSVFSGRDIHIIKNEQCDFIISTTSLEGYRLNHDVVQVGHLLEERDIKHIEDYMRKMRSDKKRSIKGIAPNTGLFSSELIFPNCKQTNKKDLLQMMCSRLEGLGYVTEGFEKSVMERENSTPTDIGKGFAIPHGQSKYVNHSIAAFASLKEPIEWVENGEMVDMVFLIAFDLDEDRKVKKEIVRFYKSIVSFMEDDRECEKLRSLTDSEQLIKIFELW